MTSSHMWSPRPLLMLKWPSSQPMGRKHATMMMPTIPIGMSCSVRGSDAACPALRTLDAAIADDSPLATGCTSLASVQIAATPIVPAPTKRTWWLQLDCATSAIAPPAAASAE